MLTTSQPSEANHSDSARVEKRGPAPGEPPSDSSGACVDACSSRRAVFAQRSEGYEVLMAAAPELQAAYYLGSGTWPLLHRRSFEAITGPKHDFWLARTVGGLTVALGLGLRCGSRDRHGVSADLRVTAIAAAIALGAVDVIGVARGRIRPVYLVDAAALQAALIAGWLGRRRTEAGGRTR